jgi:CRISPR-associated Csx2 family protein
MSKVLISFLGTGPFEEKGATRVYREANYLLDGKEYVTTFISAALFRHFDCDKRIIIGTCKSMWEEYYRYFSEENGNFDENFYWKLAEFTDKAGPQSNEFPLLDELENRLKNPKIIILKYGLNDEELLFNLTKILEIDDYIESGDELILDITHGFRSFPLFAQQIVLYLKHVSSKEITIKGFYYAMLDAIRDLGYAPVVDMNIAQHLNDWIIAASNFINKSDGSQLVGLLEDSDRNLSNLVDNFSKALNINYSHEIKNQYERITKYDFSELPPLEKLMAEKAFGEFKKNFNLNKKHSLYQLDLAKWYCSKNLYGVSYLTLTEAIITFVAEKISPSKALEEDIRNSAKKTIHKNYPELGKLYKVVNKIRKNVAHMLEHRNDTYLNDIQNLDSRIEKAARLFKEYDDKQ